LPENLGAKSEATRYSPLYLASKEWALPRAFVHGGNAKITNAKILEKKRKMQAGKEFFQNR